MIIRGGFNVYPSDIEEMLLRIPNVQTAAVVGKEHEVDIERNRTPYCITDETFGDVRSAQIRRLQ